MSDKAYQSGYEDGYEAGGSDAYVDLLARIEVIEARQRAAGQHDPGCGANTIVGEVRVDVYRGGPTSIAVTHFETGWQGFANSDDDDGSNLEALAVQRLKDHLRDHAPDWFRSCTCWLSRS